MRAFTTVIARGERLAEMPREHTSEAVITHTAWRSSKIEGRGPRGLRPFRWAHEWNRAAGQLRRPLRRARTGSVDHDQRLGRFDPIRRGRTHQVDTRRHSAPRPVEGVLFEYVDARIEETIGEDRHHAAGNVVDRDPDALRLRELQPDRGASAMQGVVAKLQEPRLAPWSTIGNSDWLDDESETLEVEPV